MIQQATAGKAIRATEYNKLVASANALSLSTNIDTLGGGAKAFEKGRATEGDKSNDVIIVCTDGADTYEAGSVAILEEVSAPTEQDVIINRAQTWKIRKPLATDLDDSKVVLLIDKLTANVTGPPLVYGVTSGRALREGYGLFNITDSTLNVTELDDYSVLRYVPGQDTLKRDFGDGIAETLWYRDDTPRIWAIARFPVRNAGCQNVVVTTAATAPGVTGVKFIGDTGAAIGDEFNAQAYPETVPSLKNILHFVKLADGLKYIQSVPGITRLKYTGAAGGDAVGSITCSTIDGTTTGIIVALPWLLRKAAFDGKTIDGNIYTWTSSFIRNADPTPAGGGDDWDEDIFMPYTVGDIITVMSNDGSVSDISTIASYPYVEISNNRIWGRACP